MCHIRDHCWWVISRTICFSSKWIKSSIYLHFSWKSMPVICFSQANSVWTMTRQRTRSRRWHVLCNKMKYTSMGVRQPIPSSPSSPRQSKSCWCGQQNKQCLCWLSWFYKQCFVVQLHWWRTLGIVAKQLCTYMLCCLCWAVWLPQTLLLQSFSLWADRGLVTSKMSVHSQFVSLNNQENQNILINLFIFKLLVEWAF